MGRQATRLYRQGRAHRSPYPLYGSCQKVCPVPAEQHNQAFRIMTQSEVWFLPAFLGGGAYVICEEDDPAMCIGTGDGRFWKPRKRAALVQPDNPDERGAHTVVWRKPIAVLPLSAPSSEPEDIAGYFDAQPPVLALPSPTGDRVPVSNWRRIEFPRPERKHHG